VVTTGSASACNFNHAEQSPHAQRCARGGEHIDVVLKLWDSFEDDVFMRDRQSGVFFDTAEVHPTDHVGEHFQVKRPLNLSRSPQGHPVVVRQVSQRTVARWRRPLPM
jgi:alkanesulfonate monooxygenase SsuD/methylene tetrahydromethanopterin reductase-like flavin-dependent oxidoreductase (luciferase family)